MIKGSKKKPFITITRLAEYQNANATRRRQIVTNFKTDKEFNRNRYQIARTAIPKFLKNGYDIKILDKAIKQAERKLQKGVASPWIENDLENSISALEALKTADLPDLKGYEVIELDTMKDIELAGVIVWLHPDVYLRNVRTKKIGAIKVNITKTENNRLSKDSLEHASTMLQYGFINMGYGQKEVDNNACFSVDVFNGTYESAPKAYKRTIASLTASCEEYALRWDSL